MGFKVYGRKIMVQKECTLHWNLILSTNYSLLKCVLNRTFHLKWWDVPWHPSSLGFWLRLTLKNISSFIWNSYRIPNPVEVAMWVNRHGLCSETKLSRYGLHLMDWALNQMWLAAPRTFVPWLYQYVLQTESCYRSQGDINDYLSPLVTCRALLAPWTLVSRVETSN